MNDYDFGNFIFELRTEKGLSQSELGKILGVSNKAVSKWETGEAKPRSGKLTLLAETLGVSVEELLCGKRKKDDKGQGEEISFAIGVLAREYRRTKIELIVSCVCFLATPLLMLLVMGISWGTGDLEATWAISLLAIFAVLHFAAEAGVIISFILLAKRRQLLYASFPERREEVYARTNIVPPAKKRGKLGVVVLVGILLMAIAVASILYALGLVEGVVAELIVMGCALAFGFGNIVFTRLWMRRINGHMRACEYEQVLKDTKFLLEVWLPDGRNILSDGLRLHIAAAYFALRDDGNFRDYLREITTRRFALAKSFWKCLDAFAQGDREALRTEYGVFVSLAGSAEKQAAQDAAFYGERARLLYALAEGDAAAKQALLPLFRIPRILELVEGWEVE